MSSLAPLTSSDEAYNQAFQSYLKVTKKTENTIAYLKTDFIIYLKTLLESLNDDDGNETFYYCGIGSGTGVKDIAIIELIKQLKPQQTINVTIVEPNKENSKDFVNQLNQHNWTNVTFDWLTLTSQQARINETFKKKKFHLFVMMESLYYESDLVEALEFYLNHLLTKQSILLITQGYSHCAWNILNREFSQEFGTNSHIGSDDVINALNHLTHKISYSIKIIANDFPIDAVFDENSIDGGLLLDFISHTIDFRHNASDEVKKIFMKRLFDSDTTKVDANNGSRLFDMSFVSIVVKNIEFN